jgi:hypothetical protein
MKNAALLTERGVYFCLLALLGVWLEIQGTAIRAIAQTRGSGAAIEDVPQMAAAIGAMKFRAHHAVAAVGGGFHRPRLGVPEAGPAGAAVEFGMGIEQFGAAAGALELAGALFLVQRAGARALGAAFAQHAVLFRSKFAIRFGIGICHGVFLSLPNTSKAAKSYGFEAITMASMLLSWPVLPKAKPAS